MSIQNDTVMKRIIKGTATIVKQGEKRIIIIPKKYHDKVKDYEGKEVIFEVFDLE